MRHGKKINHLGRKTAHRKSMLANMACSLIEHKRINTTVAKAKALKQFVEPIITKSKAANNQTSEKETHNRRIAFKYLRNKYAVSELFGDVSAKVGDRPGGYTRIIKLGNRLGDNAEMAMIELVDYNETYSAKKPAKKKSTRRGRSRKAATVTTDETVETEVIEAEAPEAEVAKAEVPETETPEKEASEAVENTENPEEENK